MRYLGLGIVFFLLCWTPAFGGQVSFEPSVAIAGESVLIEYRDAPVAMALVRVEGRTLHLRTSEQGAWGILGVDIGYPKETIPLSLAVLKKDGTSHFSSHRLSVTKVDRPKEYLTLPEKMVTPKGKKLLARIKQERDRLLALYRVDGGSGQWSRLERPVPHPVSSVFGVRRILNGKPRSPHGGTDFRSPTGTPVEATASGTVVLTDSLYYTGKTVVIRHGDGMHSLYAHLSRIDCNVGQYLEQGEVLGAVGSTGRSTGPHLHWSMRHFGARIDPMQLLEITADLP